MSGGMESVPASWGMVWDCGPWCEFWVRHGGVWEVHGFGVDFTPYDEVWVDEGDKAVLERRVGGRGDGWYGC